MIPRHDVFGSLSDEDIQKTLLACYLLDKNEYTDDEQHIFHECRYLIEIGKTDEELAQHFSYRKDIPQVQSTVEVQPESSSDDSQEIKTKKSKKKSASKASETTSILELKQIASELFGTKLSLSQTLKLISAIGLSEKDEYTTSECEAVETFIKNQAQPVDLNSSITTAAIASEAGLALLIDRITDKLAHKVPGLVNKTYVEKVSHHLTNSTEQIQDFYVQLESVILNEIEGKSPITAMLERPWMTAPLPLSSLKSAQLPSESENDTNGE